MDIDPAPPACETSTRTSTARAAHTLGEELRVTVAPGATQKLVLSEARYWSCGTDFASYPLTPFIPDAPSRRCVGHVRETSGSAPRSQMADAVTSRPLPVRLPAGRQMRLRDSMLEHRPIRRTRERLCRR